MQGPKDLYCIIIYHLQKPLLLFSLFIDNRQQIKQINKYGPNESLIKVLLIILTIYLQQTSNKILINKHAAAGIVVLLPPLWWVVVVVV